MLASEQNSLPFLSIVIPGYNEEKIVGKNLQIVYDYMKTLEDKCRWELIFINDGSKDKTGEIAEEFKAGKDNVIICHHKVNLNLGQALKTGFAKASGDYIITLDLDLSYSPDHIERLFDSIQITDADVVIASPYLKGGQVSDVPFFRALLSRFVNKFLKLSARYQINTFTGMVRAYKRSFLSTLNLKARDYEINPEIIYKTVLLRARIVEIPAHLKWLKEEDGQTRKSNLKLLRGILSGLMSGFIFRPYMFFMTVGLVLLTISLYIIGWIVINTYEIYYLVIPEGTFIDDRFSAAVAEVFRHKPHAFFIGGFTLVIALQFLSLGFLSLQNKRYFEELFYLGTSVYKKIKD